MLVHTNYCTTDQSHIPYALTVGILELLFQQKTNSDLDLKRQDKKIAVSTNLLLRKFSKCPVDVKCDLFKKILF